MMDVMDVNVIRGAEIGSDYYLVIMKAKISVAATTKKERRERHRTGVPSEKTEGRCR